MPRVSREQTEKNRAAIEESSIRLFRERGLNGVSIAELMGDAGLTHGGFYGQFDSKEALAAVACAKGFDQAADAWARRIAKATDKPGARRNLIEGYLTTTHRDKPGAGCVATALAGDVGREPKDSPVRETYLLGLKDMVATIALLDEAPDTPEARAHALLQLSTMMGAMMLARATKGDPISDELLASAREFLTGPDSDRT